ncbi:MAG: carbohydrate kinase [Rhodoluna sp.]|nr:carbohydrate kinase [Rhodoluna sp.]
MILVIGEALIDLIENRYQAGGFNAVVGGANANVALALARRGTKHQFLGRISNDRFGKIIRERLETNGVHLEHSVVAEELTTLAVVSIDSNGVPTYAFYVNGTADWGWTDAELPTDVELENMHATAIQFGCLTMAMQPSSAVIEKWARAHFDQKSVTISHDINMRPALGFDAAEERVRVERLNQISHIIKASDEDIEWLYGLGKGADLDGIVSDWIGDTERIVLVTRGADGTSIYRKRKARIDVPSRNINVVDTVGAGDTFCANLLGQLSDADSLGSDPFDRLENLSDADLQEFVRVAAVAASITCERAGCEPPTSADLAETLRSL